jgi:D-alanyl-lipoteichoic acid acyltransferase DltB (MBOAT superfamily)
VADNLAEVVDFVFAHSTGCSPPILLLGVVLFAVQIYCDFSGYSDIAIGTARLFGFRLMRNFAFPYFSRDIAEFWRRWHISLSTWFRDYLYIPLGGSLVGKTRQAFNVVVTFAVSGLWHGANWTFVVWGLLNGLYYLPLMLLGWQRKHRGDTAPGRVLPGVREAAAILFTFGLTLFAWVFFRAESLGHAVEYLRSMLDFAGHVTARVGTFTVTRCLLYVVPLFVIEWLQRDKQHGFDIVGFPRAVRWICYLLLALVVLFLGRFDEVVFIYFQF